MSKHGLEEGVAVKRGSVAHDVSRAVREVALIVMADGSPLSCVAIVGVFQEGGYYNAMPTFATVDEKATPTLIKTLRTMADNLEAGDRGRDHIPVSAGDA